MNKEELKDRTLGMVRGAKYGKNIKHSSLNTMAKVSLDAILAGEELIISDEEKKEIIDDVVERYEMLVGVIQPEPIFIIDGDSTEWFIDAKPNTEFKYSKRYFDYLLDNDFPDDTIEKIKESTEKVLGYCANPKGSIILKEQKKRGLVVGDVQSGKTSNYISLINMACDVGYNIIVLLAGMTSSLRQQTQDRIDAGFIGAKSDTLSDIPEFIGVGMEQESYYGIPLTNHTNDFVKFVKQNQNAGSEDYNKPVVLVVKKNKSVLESVASWLKPGYHNIKKKSNILIIDDEADNASVNTKRNPDEMTAINAAIRLIYNNFQIASYVGYTATPFANIFINPFEEDPSNQDLFPADFIVLLETPSNYFGYDKVFEKNNGIYKHIDIINQDDVNYLPTTHKKDDPYLGLSSDLIDAILHFYICNVIRTLDGKTNKHRSMLINISRFNDMQKQIVEKVDEYHKEFLDELFELANKSDELFFRSRKLYRLYQLFISDKNYITAREKYSWQNIKLGLLNEVKQIQVRLINNSIKNRFSYDEYKDVGARVIIVGGFVLSRGLTLEGLIVSYFDRNSTAYDTLLQMCRWFGYRFGYEDICKIYMTQESVDSFEAVGDAVENLKEQFRYLAESHKTPKDFGFMVKESPDTLETNLMVTSRNKMYNTKQVYCTLNYSGFAVDTSKIFKDHQVNVHNFNEVKKFFDLLISKGKSLESDGKRVFVNDVSYVDVADFIDKVKIPLENTKFVQDSIVNYVRSKDNKYLAWDVVVASGSADIDFELYPSKSVKAVTRSYDDSSIHENENYYRISGNKNRLFEPSIFKTGLSEKQIDEVVEKAKVRAYLAKQEGRNRSDTPTVEDWLNVPGRKPLIVIYPVVLKCKDDKKISEFLESSYKNVIYGFAIGFPFTDKGVRIKFRANAIQWMQMTNRLQSDDEEDFEEDDD